MSLPGAWQRLAYTNVSVAKTIRDQERPTVTSLMTFLQVNSEFQTFKHIECLAPGELMRAHRALEATVAIYPTLVLTNALPYDMDIVVWQVTTQLTLSCVPAHGHEQAQHTKLLVKASSLCCRAVRPCQAQPCMQ